MKRFLYTVCAVAAAAALALFAACGQLGSGTTVAVQSVTLSETQLSLIKGATHTLTATVLPDDASDQTIVWTSSDEAVVTVDGGVVTALAEGEASVTAECGGVAQSCEVTVTPAYAPVSAEEWDAAFGVSGRDEFRVVVRASFDPDEEEIDIFEYIRTENGSEYLMSAVEGRIEAYTELTEDGRIGYSSDGTYWVKEPTEITAYEAGGAEGFLGKQGVLGIVAGFYEQIAEYYDEARGCYDADIEIEGDPTRVEGWFAEGELRRLILEVGDSSKTVMDFTFEYAGLSVTIPVPMQPLAAASAEVTAEEWTAAFGLDGREHFSFVMGAAQYAADGSATFLPEMADYSSGSGEEFICFEGEQMYSRKTTGGVWNLYGQSEDGSWYFSKQIEGTIFAGEFGDVIDMIAAGEHTFDDARECYVVPIPDFADNGEAEVYFAEDGTLVSVVMIMPDASGDDARMEYVLNFTYGERDVFPDLDAQGKTDADGWAEAFDLDAVKNVSMTVSYETDTIHYDPLITYTVADGKAHLFGSADGSVKNLYAQSSDGIMWQVYADVAGEWTETVRQDESLYVSESGVPLYAQALAQAYETFTYDSVRLCYTGDIVVADAQWGATVWFDEGRVVTIVLDGSDGAKLSVMLVYGGQTVEFPFEV